MSPGDPGVREGAEVSVWGWCATCDRWFYCGRVRPSDGSPETLCPVCLSPAALLEDRAA